MSEFHEFIEYREVEPLVAHPQSPVGPAPVWDGWGDEEDRQRFYRLRGVPAPSPEEEAKAAGTLRETLDQIPLTRSAPDDGWGQDSFTHEVR